MILSERYFRKKGLLSVTPVALPTVPPTSVGRREQGGTVRSRVLRGYLGYELIQTWKLKELRISILRAEAWVCCDFPINCSRNVTVQFRQQQRGDLKH